MGGVPVDRKSVSREHDEEQRSVLAAMDRWIEAVTGADPEIVAGLYAEDAVLWGTVSPLLRATRQGVLDYFAHFMTLEKLEVVYHDPQVRVFGELAVNTGGYTFFHEADGRMQSLPARYSFVYRKDPGGEWKIIDHHSSAVPGRA
jgi:uncharacterized protein (TIGR02246 family)